MATKYSKRHYEDVAKFIYLHNWRSAESRDEAINYWIGIFASDNPKFDPVRFADAAEGNEPPARQKKLGRAMKHFLPGGFCAGAEETAR